MVWENKLSVPQICTILKVVCPIDEFTYVEEYTQDGAMRGREQIIIVHGEANPKKYKSSQGWQFLSPNESRDGMTLLDIISKIEKHGVA